MKNRVLICLMSAVLISGTAVMAEQPETEKLVIETDVNTGMVSLSGTSTVGNDNIMIEIFEEGKTQADLEHAMPDMGFSEIDSIVIHFDQVVADGNGNYKSSFVLNADTGSYTVRVRLEKEDIYLTDEIDFINPVTAHSIIGEINGDPLKIGELIEQNVSNLGLDNDIYTALKKDRADLSQGYEKMKADIPFADWNELNASFNKNMLFEAFTQVKNNVSLADLVENYGDVLGLTGKEYYEQYLKYSAAQKEAVCSGLEKAGYENYSDIENDLLKNIVFVDIKTTSEWGSVAGKINDYLTKYSDKIDEINNIDLNGYNQLSGAEKQSAMAAFLNNVKNADNFSDLVSLFNDSCKNPGGTTDNNPGGGNGGGGGSHGGGGNSSSGSSSGVAFVGGNKPQSTQTTAPETKKEFTDLDTVEWAKPAINALRDKGVVSGRSETIFDPMAFVTREEFVTMAVKAFGLTSDVKECSFADADSAKWYYDYLAIAEAQDIVYGDETGNFGVGRNITREDMAVILYRMMNKEGSAPEKTEDAVEFTDTPSEYAKEAVSELQQYGVVNGMSDGSFAPKKNATRAESAQMIYSMMKLLGKI